MMVEKRIMDWLSGKLRVPAYAHVPKSAPKSFITVERVGGGVEDMLDHPRIAIQAWAPTAARASALSLDVQRLLTTTSFPGLSGVEVETIYRFDAPDSDLARYQLIINATTKIGA